MKTTGKLLAPSLALLLFLTLLPGCGKSPEGMELYFFAAGKADAILITAPGAAVMVDTGEKGLGKEILDYLEEKGIGKLDALILTHFDKDHVGGAAKLLSGIPIDRVIQSNVPRDSGEYRDYVRALERAGLEAETPREPVTLSLGDLEIVVDPPKQEEYEKDPSNNSSLIVSVRYGDTSALLTGAGLYQKLAKHAGAGTLVPITGFANAVSSSAIESSSEGWVLGIGAKIFTIAGPVILYGCAASAVYGLLYYIIV